MSPNCGTNPLGLVSSAVFSSDGSLVLTASKDGTARLWRLDGELVFSLAEPEGQVTRAVFSPDGEWIVTASSSGYIRFWPSTEEHLRRIAGELARRQRRFTTAELEPYRDLLGDRFEELTAESGGR